MFGQRMRRVRLQEENRRKEEETKRRRKEEEKQRGGVKRFSQRAGNGVDVVNGVEFVPD